MNEGARYHTRLNGSSTSEGSVPSTPTILTASNSTQLSPVLAVSIRMRFVANATGHRVGESTTAFPVRDGRAGATEGFSHSNCHWPLYGCCANKRSTCPVFKVSNWFGEGKKKATNKIHNMRRKDTHDSARKDFVSSYRGRSKSNALPFFSVFCCCESK